MRQRITRITEAPAGPGSRDKPSLQPSRFKGIEISVKKQRGGQLGEMDLEINVRAEPCHLCRDHLRRKLGHTG